MSATGRGAKREALDFYSTPAWATDAILDVLMPRCATRPPRILEPAAGDGAIIDRLLARGVSSKAVQAVEIQRERGEACRARTGVDPLCGDFLLMPLEDLRFELIITNPPYRQAEEFARRAMRLLAPGGVLALLLRLNWLAGQRRAPFHRAHPADVHVLPKRPAFGDATGTDACDYGWFVWGAAGGRWSLLSMPEAA